MRVVTAKYAAFRRHNVNSLLSWHDRNECFNYGYITVSTKPIGRRFSIARWLGEDKHYYYDCEGDFLRYDPFFEYVDWKNARRPWEREQEDHWIEREFNTVEEKEKFLYGSMLNMKCERCGVLYPPFDALPIGWTLNKGKVTLW